MSVVLHGLEVAFLKLGLIIALPLWFIAVILAVRKSR